MIRIRKSWDVGMLCHVIIVAFVNFLSDTVTVAILSDCCDMGWVKIEKLGAADWWWATRSGGQWAGDAWLEKELLTELRITWAFCEKTATEWVRKEKRFSRSSNWPSLLWISCSVQLPFFFWYYHWVHAQGCQQFLRHPRRFLPDGMDAQLWNLSW